MENDPSYLPTPKDPNYPVVRYHPDGRSVRVADAAQDQKLIAEGWAGKPFPPPEPPEERLDLQGQLDALERRVLVLEGVPQESKRKKAS